MYKFLAIATGCGHNTLVLHEKPIKTTQGFFAYAYLVIDIR